MGIVLWKSILEDGDVLLISVDIDNIPKSKAEKHMSEIKDAIRNVIKNKNINIVVVSKKVRFEIMKNKSMI